MINGFGKATRTMVDDFESHIGFLLPDDYKEFLYKYNGGTPQIKYSTFFVKELKQKIPLDVLLGLGVNKLDLQKRNDEYSDDLLSNSIIIGDDPGSGMIVLINDLQMKGVYYWDHSFNFKQSNEENNIYKITNNFQDFINNFNIPHD